VRCPLRSVNANRVRDTGAWLSFRREKVPGTPSIALPIPPPVESPVMPVTTTPPQHTVFDWRIYAEATCAGLTPLLPLPFVDLAFEAVFRHRMPGNTARVRGRDLAKGAPASLSHGTGLLLSLEGCLRLPLGILRYILRRVWRKLVYVFAIADAATLTSEYWHRAYLLDHVIRAGHAGPDVDWRRTSRVFDKVLQETDVSPLMGVAKQTVANAHRVVRMLVRARRHDAAEETESLSTILGSNWIAAEASLMGVAVRYNQEYSRSLELDPPELAIADSRQPGQDDS